MKMRQYTLLLLLLTIVLATACRKKKTDTPVTNTPVTTDTGAKWQLYGNPIEANNPNAYATIAIDNSGTVYLLFADGNADNKATAMKLVNNTWSALGHNGFSAGKVFKPAMALHPATGLPYVAYVETSSFGINKVNVMQFDGLSWVSAGSTNFQANSIGAASISLDNMGNPAITYIAPPYTGMVMQYNGSAWTNLFTSDAAKRVYDIDYIAGTQHLAYLWDTAIGITHLDVLKNTAGNWNNLNFPTSISPTSYTINTYGGVPYLAIEGKGPIRQASVMKYAGSWTNIGKANFTAGVAANPSVVISPDSINTAYLSYKDGSDKAVIMSYTDDWNNVGINFPTATISHISHAVSPADKVLYVALSRTDGTITVMCYK